MQTTYHPEPFDTDATKFEIRSWPEVLMAKAIPSTPPELIKSVEDKALDILKRAHKIEQDYHRHSQQFNAPMKWGKRMLIRFSLVLLCPIVVLMTPVPIEIKLAAAFCAVAIGVGLVGIGRDLVARLRRPNPFTEPFHQSELSSQRTLGYLRGSLDAYCIQYDDRDDSPEGETYFN